MCDKCTKRARGMEIVNLELKISNLFKKIEANPSNYENDSDLIRLLDTLGKLVDKYRK